MTRIRQRAEHRWAHRRLSDYVDGELTLRARRRLQRHADQCPDCGPTLDSLIRVVHALRTLPQTDRPSIAPAVISRLRQEPVELTTRRTLNGPSTD
jgi:anti-sigma factor RsiW